MNILIHALPLGVDVAGVTYPVNVDFRAALQTILCFEDNGLTQFEKTSIMLSNLYIKFPKDFQAACVGAEWFLNGGRVNDDASGPRLYSFSQDAEYIFSAFHQTHKIDLQNVDLHWWKFLALFMDLGQDTSFCGLVALRKRIKAGTATKEEKAAASDMGEAFNIPEIDRRTLAEREADDEFLRLIGQAKNG